MKAVVFDEIGPPTDVLKLADVPIQEVGEREVLVKMIAAPINPGDFLFIQNLYPEPKKPHFPQQIAGNYGAGIVEKVGKKSRLEPGTLVSATHYNTWAEYAVVPEQWLISLPIEYPVEKAAQFMNFITGRDLLKESGVQPGQWLLLTAGNSTVAERFELHNFDLLMKGAAIKTYIYRYFFTPPPKRDTSLLQKIAEISASAGFRTPLGGVHSLSDFKAAIAESTERPETGKRIFKM